MKRKIILSLITISVLSFASCGNSTTEEPETTVPVETTAEATPEPTVTPEPTATPNVETGTVEESTDSTSSIDSTGVDSKIDEGDYIDPTPAQVTTSSDTAEVPKDIYDPASTEPMENRYQKVEDAYTSGKITESQYRDLVLKILNGDGNSTSSNTTGSTGSSTSGDTYIPAHGNPGTVNDAAPDPNYVPPHATDNADLSWAIGTTIE